MPDPVDIYARLRFQQGTVAADARAAMEAARKEFSQGINVPLRFQQQGGIPAGGGTIRPTAGGITATTGTTAAISGQVQAAVAQAATKAAQAAAGAVGTAGAAGVGGAAGQVAPAASAATKSLNQLTQGLRTITRVASIAEGVAAVGELAIHGGRLAGLGGDQDLLAAREVSAMQQTIRQIPLIGSLADRIGGIVYDIGSSVKNFATGGRFESDQSYAARTEEAQKYEDRIAKMQSERARAFLRPSEAAVGAAQETGSEFAASEQGRLLKQENPETYARMMDEINRRIGVVKVKAAIDDEREEFRHQQKLTGIQTQAEVARLDAAGAHVQAQRKTLAAGYDAQIREAEDAAKHLREVGQENAAAQQDETAGALRGLKDTELQRFDVRNRFVGFSGATEMWKRINEATAKYTASIRDAGKATEDTGKKITKAGEDGATAAKKLAEAWDQVHKAASKPIIPRADNPAAEAKPFLAPPINPAPTDPHKLIKRWAINPDTGAMEESYETGDVTGPGGGIVAGMDLGGDVAASLSGNKLDVQIRNLQEAARRAGVDIPTDQLGDSGRVYDAAIKARGRAMQGKTPALRTAQLNQMATLQNLLRLLRTKQTGRVPGSVGYQGAGMRALGSEEYRSGATTAYEESEIQEMPLGFRLKRMAEEKQAESTPRGGKPLTPEEMAASRRELGTMAGEAQGQGAKYFNAPVTITPENIKQLAEAMRQGVEAGMEKQQNTRTVGIIKD